jgi:hypothetical protein
MKIRCRQPFVKSVSLAKLAHAAVILKEEQERNIKEKELVSARGLRLFVRDRLNLLSCAG